MLYIVMIAVFIFLLFAAINLMNLKKNIKQAYNTRNPEDDIKSEILTEREKYHKEFQKQYEEYLQSKSSLSPLNRLDVEDRIGYSFEDDEDEFDEYQEILMEEMEEDEEDFEFEEDEDDFFEDLTLYNDEY